MIHKPFIGDKVRLNDHGLNTIYRTVLGLSTMKLKIMTIIDVESISLTEPEHTWAVDVDDPEINMFLLSQHDFDLVNRNEREKSK